MSFFDKVKTSVHQTYVKTAEKIMPTLKDSKFLEEGVLTPEEFVAAGDLLVHKCPTWSWEAAEDGKAVSYLPKDKQFLLTRNVPCSVRLKQFEGDIAESTSTTIADDDGDWEAPTFKSSKAIDASEASTTSTAAASSATSTSSTTTTNNNNDNNNNSSTATANGDDDDDDDSSDIPDMEDFDDENLGEADDDATLAAPAVPTDNIMRTRTYDISITYDKYYQTPKLWLFGYDESNQPLRAEQLFEDISADHAQKTVTIDTHPHQATAWAFIHPCRHSAVMKRIIERQQAAGKKPRADQYIFLFLKFISAVIPCIEYDYTMEVDG